MRDPSSSAGSRADRVVAAATEVFLRYGFARTTMGDIAKQAGISRPALYLVFPGKEEVFAAVIHRMNDDSLVEIRAALPTLPTVRDRVLFACDAWGGYGYDLMAAHPDAKDLFDLTFGPVRAIYAEFQALIADLLVDLAPGSALAATPAELARTVTLAMRGFEESATDGRDMRRLIEVQVDLLLTALERRG